MRMPAALVTAIAAIVGPSLAAAASPALPSPTLSVSGRATIYHDDLAGARERAVEAAMIRALEQYAGVRIEASTLIKKGELIDREVRANTHGFVRSFEVLDTTREGNELVANVRVTVAAEPVEESFRRMMSATTTLLLVREANLGQPVDGALLAPVLADPFFTANLVAPPAASLAWLDRGLAAAFYSSPDPATARSSACAISRASSWWPRPIPRSSIPAPTPWARRRSRRRSPGRGRRRQRDHPRRRDRIGDRVETVRRRARIGRVRREPRRREGTRSTSARA